MLATDQMHFVHHKQIDVLDGLSLLPTPREHVPPLRGRDNDLASFESVEVRGCLSGQVNNFLA